MIISLKLKNKIKAYGVKIEDKWDIILVLVEEVFFVKERLKSLGKG